MRTSWLWMGALIVCLGCGESTSDGGAGNSGGASGGTSGSSGASGSGGASGNGGASGGASGASGSSGASGNGGASGGAGGASSVLCNPATVTCKVAIPDCPKGQVPSVEGNCWGKCVDILQCATESDCSNCSNGFCAKYESFVQEYRCVMPSLQCSALACSCLADYFCVGAWSSCSESPSGPQKITCSCPAC
ncbi:MAG: hypothetical protein R3B13_06180 [Polyangiaceae bacterium]